MSTKILTFYDCDPDGLAAAAAIKEFYQGVEEGTLDLVFERAIRYQDPDYSLVDEDTNVFIVDFAYKADVTRKLCQLARRVIVIDHHDGTKDDLEPLLEEFDNFRLVLPEEGTNVAACRLTWDYLFADDASVPSLIRYVSDMDTWTWELPKSEEISAAIDSETATVDRYHELLEQDMVTGQVFRDGLAIQRYKNKVLDLLETQAVLMEIGGHKVRAVNCADPALVSYLGNRLCLDAPFGATFYLQPNGKWKFSIRSKIGEGLPGIDVGAVARQYGGGGRDQTAGFKVDRLPNFEVIPDSEAHR